MMALSRATDPHTSALAASGVEHAGPGGAEDQRNRCLLYVRLYPGRTAAEIADALGMERHAPSRRLPELRHAGLVRNGEARKCEVMGRQSLTWLPVDEPAEPKDTEPRRRRPEAA